MQNFGYCIWLLPEKNSQLYNLTKGFKPHISLATKMDLDSSLSKFKNISKKKINVKIIDKPICTTENNFYALQFNVSIIDSSLP